MVVADGGGGLGFAGETPPGGGAAGQGRGQNLDRHQPMQRRLERLQDDPHAPGADHFADFVVAEEAEDARPVGGPQEGEVGGVGFGVVRRRRRLVQPGQDLREGGVGRRVGRVADAAGQPQQGGGALDGLIEALLAGRTLLQVPLEPLALLGGHVGGEQGLPVPHLWAFGRSGHG